MNNVTATGHTPDTTQHPKGETKTSTSTKTAT